MYGDGETPPKNEDGYSDEAKQTDRRGAVKKRITSAAHNFIDTRSFY
jgi:hypothetical protein